jgi:two-component system response regulator AtoC
LSVTSQIQIDKNARLLLVGHNEDETRILADALAADYPISAAPSIQEAAQRLQKTAFSVIIFDLADDGSDLVNSIENLQEYAPGTPIIVIGHQHDSQLIVRAVKAGAFDFVTKPYPPEKIKLSVHQALENRSLKNEIDYLRREQDVVYNYEQIIAVSGAMQEVIKTIKRLAGTDSTVLVTGETGTGKSFLSGNIHFNSPRRNKPFIKVNCANIPETLLESELFGHEKGSFTGADKTRTGRFEQADGGTIFLDEFCELGLDLQAKLLRAIEEKAFERLGDNKTIHADTRILAATNRDIEALIRAGQFREDLYYRINVLRIHLPPCQYAWPGNIRQLSNTIERAILMEDQMVIRKSSVSLPEIEDLTPHKAQPTGLKLSENQEKELIANALEDNLWIQKDAARQLDISPRALNYRIKKLGITHARWRKNK